MKSSPPVQLVSAVGAAGAVFGENRSEISGAYDDFPIDCPAAGFIAGEYCTVNRGDPDPGRPGRPAVTVQDPVYTLYTLYPVRGTGGSHPGSHHEGPRRSEYPPVVG